jgi:nitrogen-specific signal transduction histidine kinase
VDEPVDHATLLLDRERRIKAVSASVVQFLRVSVAQVIGRPVGEFLPKLSLLAEGHDRRYPRGEKARLRLSREHTVAQLGDGTEVPVTVSLFETREEGGILLWLRHLHTEGEAYCPVPDYCPVPESKLLRVEES